MIFKRRDQRNGKSFNRSLGIERLESRRVLTAEGAAFDLTSPVDLAGLVGSPSAVVDWGDGKTSNATITGGSTLGSVQIRFDYSLDTSGFFNDPARRTALNAAAAMVSSRLADQLSAITPSGANVWTATTENPATGEQSRFSNLQVAANEIIVYVGARDLPGSQLGQGVAGGFSVQGITQEWLDTVRGRGQSGALLRGQSTDFGPWGGTLAFDSNTDWYFGLSETGIPERQFDFVTVAAHELMHLLGFGASDSWQRLVSGGSFTGPKATAEYDPGGNVPLADNGHFVETITDSGRRTIMGPLISAGIRDTPTPLDLAALDDIGWDLTPTAATLSAQHVYADNGNYTITIAGRGATVGNFTATASAAITNVVPTLNVVSNQTVLAGEPLSLINIGTISDPGFDNPSASPPTNETLTYTINWGDNSAVASGTATIDRNGSPTATTLASFDGSHTYETPGTYTVTVSASDDDGGTAQQTFQVLVNAPPVLTLELNRDSIAENAGANAATLTIRRSGTAATTPITVTLSSSDPTEATVPASAVIPADATFVTVPVNAVDDTLLDGIQTVTLSASGALLVTGTTTLSVTDRETLSAALTAATVREDAAPGSFFLTIARSNTDIETALDVSIAGNVDSEITVPLTATIPAGAPSVRVPVEPINDDDPEPSLKLTYRITAPGYDAATADLTLIDDEPPFFQNPDNRFNVDGSDGVFPLDALRIINLLTRRTAGADLNPAVDDFNGLFPDVNGDYQITPLDALQVINAIARARATQNSQVQSLRVIAPIVQSPSVQDHDAAIMELQDAKLF